MPGWLYEVDMGATTVWERWNSVLPDGHISSTGMNSLNHYAYGSIASWMYQYLCGIHPEAPGGRHYRLQPIPCPELDHAFAEVAAPLGVVRCGWRRESGNVKVEITIPFGSEATLIRPGASPISLKVGSFTFLFGEPEQKEQIPSRLNRYTDHLDLPLGVLLADDSIRDELNALAPTLLHGPEEILMISLRELREEEKYRDIVGFLRLSGFLDTLFSS